MKKLLLIGAGALLVVVGIVWTLQGLGYLGGSVMTGVALWAVIGPVVGLIGAAVLIAGLRGHR